MNAPILIIDDDEHAFVVMSHVLELVGADERIEWLRDGETAIDHLQKLVQRQLDLPVLIVLDLNLPRKSGFEVLSWMKATPALDRVLTVVVSVSVAPEEIGRALQLGAFTYFEKFPLPKQFACVYDAAKSRLVASRV